MQLENSNELYTDVLKLEAQRLECRFNKLYPEEVLFRVDTEPNFDEIYGSSEEEIEALMYNTLDRFSSLISKA